MIPSVSPMAAGNLQNLTHSTSAPVERRYGEVRALTVMVIVPVLSAHCSSTINAVMPFWKWEPLPFTAMLFRFTVEIILSEGFRPA
jgi:hypothetical protein